MESLWSTPDILSGQRSPPTLFNVVIVYEDFATGNRAKKGLDYVAEELGGNMEFRHSMWRLEVLQEPALSVMAAPALAEADLLIISLRGDSRLPAEIRELIDERLAQTANHDCALVAVFEAVTPSTRSSIYACLAKLARLHGLDLFEQALGDADDGGEPSLKLVWVF
jgi:hypothetical protein